MQVSLNYDQYSENDEPITESVYTTFGYHMFFDQTLSGSLRWNKDIGTGTISQSYYFNYMMPFSLPVGVKFGKPASIKGKVVDLNSGKRAPIPDAALIVNNSIVKTDEKGEFSMGPFVSGECSINVDNRSIGLDNITERKTYVVDVREGQTATLEIGVIKACDIFGRIDVTNDTDSEGQGGVAIVGSDVNMSGGGEAARASSITKILNGVVIGITNGNETYYQVTENGGSYNFSHIRPGKWTVTAYSKNMPNDYYLEQKDIEADLSPGDEKLVIFKALPVVKIIKIIDFGQIKENTEKANTPTPQSAAKKPAASGFIYHVVKSGETLKSISKKYFGTESYYLSIANMNSISPVKHPKVGSRLKILVTPRNNK